MAGMYPDNQELTIFGEKVQWPGVDSFGKFSNGSFIDPLEKPSFIPAETINLILDNLSELIKKFGGTPDNTSIDQLAKLFTVDATANTGIQRDAAGRAKVAAPEEDDDIARKVDVDTSNTNILESTKSYTEQKVQSEATTRAQEDANVLKFTKDYTDSLFIKIFQNGYIQWPGMPRPDTLFSFDGYRWAEVNYNGCFFRAKGSNAYSFDGGEQYDAIRNIRGYFGGRGLLHHYESSFFDGSLFSNYSMTRPGCIGNNGEHGAITVSFDASRVVPTAEENRPRNRTFIIWRLEKI